MSYSSFSSPWPLKCYNSPAYFALLMTEGWTALKTNLPPLFPFFACISPSLWEKWKPPQMSGLKEAAAVDDTLATQPSANHSGCGWANCRSNRSKHAASHVVPTNQASNRNQAKPVGNWNMKCGALLIFRYDKTNFPTTVCVCVC